MVSEPFHCCPSLRHTIGRKNSRHQIATSRNRHIATSRHRDVFYTLTSRNLLHRHIATSSTPLTSRRLLHQNPLQSDIENLSKPCGCCCRFTTAKSPSNSPVCCRFTTSLKKTIVN